MNQMGFSINVPLDTSQFRTSKVPRCTELAKNNTEMLNSYQRCSNSSIFCINAKTVQPGTFTKFFRRERTRETFAKILLGFYIILALTVLYFGVVADATGAGDQISARSASLWGTHGNIK